MPAVKARALEVMTEQLKADADEQLKAEKEGHMPKSISLCGKYAPVRVATLKRAASALQPRTHAMFGRTARRLSANTARLSARSTPRSGRPCS